MRGGGRRPLRIFPKIHPIWQRHPSITALRPLRARAGKLCIFASSWKVLQGNARHESNSHKQESDGDWRKWWEAEQGWGIVATFFSLRPPGTLLSSGTGTKVPAQFWILQELDSGRVRNSLHFLTLFRLEDLPQVHEFTAGEGWTEMGKMKKARASHAVAAFCGDSG